MKIVYTNDPLPKAWSKSIFLAGPTPRSEEVKSWRPDALRLLEEAGYDGVVFVPEFANWKALENYEGQVDWEHECLDRADCILFWVPRNLATLPAFTTNVEFGLYADSGKVVLGCPPGAPKNRYLQLTATKKAIPQVDTLRDAVNLVVRMIGDGAERRDGETSVPLNIWRTPYFRSWYANLKKAGNRLDEAKVQWVCMAGKTKQFLYAWAMHVNVWVGKERRNKTNEVVVARPDISAVLLYRKAATLEESEIVLVKEFRSPVCNDAGFVWELPGGSSKKPTSWRQTAIEEVHEEAGLKLPARRFREIGSRQLVAPFSVHRAHLFAVKLTKREMDHLKAQKGIVHGDKADYGGEMTYVEVWKVKDLIAANVIDWSNLGMILLAIR